jgi:DHA1 family inner membrane transport protein
MALGVSVLLTAGTLSVFTYIVLFLVEVTGIARNAVPAVLLAFGIGGTIGMFVGARFADWRLQLTIVAILVGLLVTYLLMLAVQTNPVLTITAMVIWGFLVYAPAAPRSAS